MSIRNTCPCCKTYHDSTGCRAPEPQTKEPSLLERMASALKNLTIYLHYGHDCGADCTMLCKDVLQGKAILAEYEQWRAEA